MTLKMMGVDDFQLSILILSDKSIKELNKKYFNKNSPTDVIAFPMQKGEFAHINPDLLGDVVISAQRASIQAKQLKHTIHQEIDILVVHGILHILGFNDDTEEKKIIMHQKTDELIKNITLSSKDH